MAAEVVKQVAPIQQRLMEFIRREFRPGYNHYNVSKLIGDASARQYFRYVSEAGESFILAVYPEPFDPDSFAYGQIHELFSRIGLPVPRIHALDGALGIVLQEDLGNTTLQKHFLAAPLAERLELLRRAVDYIVTIQREGSRLLPTDSVAYPLAFDEEKLSWELNFFRRHYLQKYCGLGADSPELDEEFARLARELAQGPRRLCHRDYHVRNLMLHQGAIYLIDFQDARWGPLSYDLVSLLKDSIELGPDQVRALEGYYLERSAFTGSVEDFTRQFHLMAIQRLLKALGTYAYQIGVRENFLYEQYMIGSLHRASLSLDALAEFPCIQDLVASQLEGRREEA